MRVKVHCGLQNQLKAICFIDCHNVNKTIYAGFNPLSAGAAYIRAFIFY